MSLRGLGSTRVIGLDTPEVHGAQECYGSEASAFARRMVRRGARVRDVPGEERRDRYGRPLVYLWLADGRSFNAMLAEGGYARTLSIAPNDRTHRACGSRGRRGASGAAAGRRARSGGPARRTWEPAGAGRRALGVIRSVLPARQPREAGEKTGPRGKSGHRRAGWSVTPTRGNPRESATERTPPKRRSVWRTRAPATPPPPARVKRCGKSAPAARRRAGQANPTRCKAKQGR